MTLWRLAFRSLLHHRVSTLVTLLSIALASGLVTTVFAVQSQSYQAFTGGARDFDAVLGARGSSLQLVLNSVFHLETSPGNLPWSVYRAIARDPRVARAIPYAVGDNYKGFRIVGTVPELFGTSYSVQGKVFNPRAREAVVGSFVAARTGLAIGAKIHPYHGLVYDESMRHEDEYTVVGIMDPTGSPADRVVWIPIEGIFRMSGHVLRGSGQEYTSEEGVEIPDEHKQVSAVMLKLKSQQAGFALEQTVNRQGQVATLAWPIGRVMAELFDKLGWMSKILTMVAYLVVLVACGSILASLYNTIELRRREFAVLRALGAPRSALMKLLLLEATTLAAGGSLLGLGVYAVLLGLAALVVRQQTGVMLSIWSFHPALVLTPVAVTLMGLLSGILPAWKAYRTDVATELSPV